MKTRMEIKFDWSSIVRSSELRKEIQRRLPIGQRLVSVIEHREEPVTRNGEVVFHEHIATIRVAMSAREGRRFAAEMAARENKYK